MSKFYFTNKTLTFDVSPRSTQILSDQKICIFQVLCNPRNSLEYHLVEQVRLLSPHPAEGGSVKIFFQLYTGMTDKEKLYMFKVYNMMF